MNTIQFEYETDDGEECVGELPAAFEVCSRCEGRGSHVNPNVDGHGISAEEWANEWDDESREEYLSGGYDVSCEKCHGRNVTLEIDEDAIENGSAETKALFKTYCDIQDSLAETEAIYAAERRMGA